MLFFFIYAFQFLADFSVVLKQKAGEPIRLLSASVATLLYLIINWAQIQVDKSQKSSSKTIYFSVKVAQAVSLQSHAPQPLMST